MTSRDFCYWLQGFLEIGAAGTSSDLRPALTVAQYDCIQKHLNLVFKHEIDPSFGDKKKQAELNKIHGLAGSAGRQDLVMRC